MTVRSCTCPARYRCSRRSAHPDLSSNPHTDLAMATHHRIPIRSRARETCPDNTHAEMAPVGSHDSRPPIATKRSIGHDQKTQEHPPHPASPRLPPTTSLPALPAVSLSDHGSPLLLRRSLVTKQQMPEARRELGGVRPVGYRCGEFDVWDVHGRTVAFAQRTS